MKGEKMKILITGRYASGTETLKHILQENYHWMFAEPETINSAMPNDKIVMKTVRDGKKMNFVRDIIYWADAVMTETPQEALTIIQNMPEETFRLIYVTASNETAQKEMLIRGSDNPDKILADFAKRQAEESKIFDPFEDMLSSKTFSFDNCAMYMWFKNDFSQKSLENLAITLEMDRRFDKNIGVIIDDMIDCGLIETDKNGNPTIFKKDQKIAIKKSLMQEIVASNTKQLGEMVSRWFRLPGVDLSAVIMPGHIDKESDEFKTIMNGYAEPND